MTKIATTDGEAAYRIVAVHGTAGDCYPEQLYGQDDPPVFATRAEAESEIAALLPAARDVAPGVEYEIEETP